MTFEPDQGAFPQVCPYLGLADDADSHATYSTEAHRCFKLPRPTKIALGHQDTYCLGEAHTTCPIFQGEGVPATQQPTTGAPAAGAAAAGAGAAAAGTAAGAAAASSRSPFETSSSPAQTPAPRPMQPVESTTATPRPPTAPKKSSTSLGPKSPGISMPMATVGLFAIAIGVIALVLLVLNFTGGDDDDDLSPADEVATNDAQTEEAGGGDETPEETVDASPTTGGEETAAPTATPPANGGSEHVVVAGDTCGAIAEANSITLDELLAANNMTEEDCNNLQVGDVLTIPPAGG